MHVETEKLHRYRDGILDPGHSCDMRRTVSPLGVESIEVSGTIEVALYVSYDKKVFMDPGRTYEVTVTPCRQQLFRAGAPHPHRGVQQSWEWGWGMGHCLVPACLKRFRTGAIRTLRIPIPRPSSGSPKTRSTLPG